MASFVRVTGVILFLALIALGFFLVEQDRTNDAVSTAELVIRGCIPVVVGFLLAWGGLYFGDRLDSRPCPRCGRRMPVGSYWCSGCGWEFRQAPR